VWVRMIDHQPLCIGKRWHHTSGPCTTLCAASAAALQRRCNEGNQRWSATVQVSQPQHTPDQGDARSAAELTKRIIHLQICTLVGERVCSFVCLVCEETDSPRVGSHHVRIPAATCKEGELWAKRKRCQCATDNGKHNLLPSDATRSVASPLGEVRS
jgi:hypothetical protein